MFGLCLTIFTITAFAESRQLSIPMLASSKGEPEEKDWPSKGHRIPAATEICTIDFDSFSIVTSFPNEITTYELWNEDSNVLLVSYASDYELVEYMSRINGTYLLRLVTVEGAYIGYIEL